MNLFSTQIPVNERTPKLRVIKPFVCRTLFFMHYKNYSLENIVAEINGIIYTEAWLPLIDYEGIYEISSFGRIKNISKKRVSPTGFIYDIPIFILHVHRDKKRGYCQLEITKDGTGTTRRVHRLVAKTFIPNPENLPQINHIDGVKINNHISNLEWSNNSLNQIHAYKLGLNKQKSGELHHNSKLTDLQVVEIKDKYNKGQSAYSLAKVFKVNRVTIGRIVKNKRNGK